MKDRLEEIVESKTYPDSYSDYPSTSGPRLDNPVSTSSAIFGTVLQVPLVYVEWKG